MTDRDKPMDDVLRDILMPEGAILTSYVILAEGIHPEDGQPFLVGDFHDGMTMPYLYGLLHYGLDHYDWEDGEDD